MSKPLFNKLVLILIVKLRHDSIAPIGQKSQSVHSFESNLRICSEKTLKLNYRTIPEMLRSTINRWTVLFRKVMSSKTLVRPVAVNDNESKNRLDNKLIVKNRHQIRPKLSVRFVRTTTKRLMCITLMSSKI